LAIGLLESFLRQEESRGSELSRGSGLERALALRVTQHRLDSQAVTIPDAIERWLSTRCDRAVLAEAAGITLRDAGG